MERTLGVFTDYIRVMDFDMDQADKSYALQVKQLLIIDLTNLVNDWLLTTEFVLDWHGNHSEILEEQDHWREGLLYSAPKAGQVSCHCN